MYYLCGEVPMNSSSSLMDCTHSSFLSSSATPHPPTYWLLQSVQLIQNLIGTRCQHCLQNIDNRRYFFQTQLPPTYPTYNCPHLLSLYLVLRHHHFSSQVYHYLLFVRSHHHSAFLILHHIYSTITPPFPFKSLHNSLQLVPSAL